MKKEFVVNQIVGIIIVFTSVPLPTRDIRYFSVKNLHRAFPNFNGYSPLLLEHFLISWQYMYCTVQLPPGVLFPENVVCLPLDSSLNSKDFNSVFEVQYFPLSSNIEHNFGNGTFFKYCRLYSILHDGSER